MTVASRPPLLDPSLVDPLRPQALSDAYRRGTTTPADVVRRIGERIAARGDDGVWIQVDLARALADAEALGDVPDPARPLWGIPFAVKDNIDVAGWTTTAACPGMAYEAAQTATAVRRLVEAGAVLVGKTNLDQFATGLNGTRSPYGVPRSVADEAMISGGSSSGSAVAVAAGLVSFALGTDTAGSGRVPAALNGIVGVKPSRGLVSTMGVVPACRSLDCLSVFALDLRGAAIVTEIVAASDPLDPWSRPLRPPTPEAVPAVRGLRLAVPDARSLRLDRRHGYDEAWDATLRALRAAGAELIEVGLDAFFEAGRLLYDGPWLAERLAATRDFVLDRPTDVLPVVLDVLARGTSITGVDAFVGLDRLKRLRRDAETTLAGVDALLTPTVETTFSVDEMLDEPISRNAALGRFTTFSNLLDLAVVSIPAGGRPDRPFGVSLSGAAGSDGRLAGIALAVEPVLGGAHDAGAGPDDPPRAVLPIAVVGAHLRGMPLHHELVARGATFVREAATDAEYRLFALDTVPPKPGLVRTGPGGARIDVEVYELPVEEVGRFLAGISDPLGIGTIVLDDGTRVHGFLCEAVAVDGARDITRFGGWRAYAAAR